VQPALGEPALANETLSDRFASESEDAYATQALSTVSGLRPIGTAANKASVLSFVIDRIPAERVGNHLDQHGIAVRSGHHCAQPAVRRFGLESTVRPSLAFYNTREDIDQLTRVLHLLPQK
jgi:cysteine desulfurase / selenocysteine lyase